MMKTTRLIAALIFCALTSFASADTYTGLTWGLDRTSSPYKIGINLSGIWYNFATITSGGVVAMPAGSISGTPWAITASQIASTNISSSIKQFNTSGYATVGDVGAGAPYVHGTPSGPGAVQSLDGQWWNIPTNIPLYTSWFGAKLDATASSGTDDTAATVAAIAADAGHGVIINGPTRLDTITVTTSNHNISCTSANGAPIFAKTATSTPLIFNNTPRVTNISLHDCSFYSYNAGAATQSAGSYVWANNCFQCNFYNLNFSQGYTSLYISGINANFVNVSKVNSSDAANDHYLINAGYGGIVFDAVTSVKTGGVTEANSGLHVFASGGLFVHDSYFIGSGNCILMDPSSSGTIPFVAWASFVNVHGDSCATGVGWKINPQAGGTVSAIAMSNTWSGSSIAGIAVSCTGGGVVDGLYIENHRSALNQNDGVSLGCGQNIQMVGGLIGNNNLSLGAFNGISVAANLSHLSFRNMVIGMLPSSGIWTSPGPTQVHAISVLAGTGDYIDFTDNDTQGGSTGTEINIVPTNANGRVSNYAANTIPGTLKINTLTGYVNCNGTAGNCTAATNIPVSALNSGTGASSTTFWRGDGTWATPSFSSIAFPAPVTGAVSGSIPYFSSTTQMSVSALLAANAIMVGGGPGFAPSTVTTGTGVVTALGVNTGSAGAFVVNGGALGTPSSGTLTNATGLPISTGVSGLGTGVATALGVSVGSAGSFVTNGGALGTPSSGTLTNATGLPISTGVSGLGAGVATFLATPSSANLASAITDETGTAGSVVFSVSPTVSAAANGSALFAQSDNSTATPAQIQIRGATNSNMSLILGYNTTSSYGVVQALTQGTSFDPLALNPNGGNVLVNKTSGSYPLDVTGDINSTTLYRVGGTAGVSATKTVRDAAGTGTCTLIFTGGLLTGGTC